MYQPRRRRNAGLLWTLIVIAAIYAVRIRFWHGLTGIPDLDASIGVLLGLFICSRGAANLLDMILFGRILQRLASSKRSEALWLAFNVLILVIGWGIIFMGTTQFIQVAASHHIGPPGWR